MTLDTYMREALDRATEMVREEGGARPTFLIASAEGTYTLALAPDGTLDLDDIAMQAVAAVMRWSMARAFIMTCEHTYPSSLAAYVVTVDGVQGVSMPILRKDPLRLGTPELVNPPATITALGALIPPRMAQLSLQEVANLEEALGMDLEDCLSHYLN